MYAYKINDIFVGDKIRFLSDDKVFFDPYKFFNSENIYWWLHKDDVTWEIDLDNSIKGE